MDGEGEDEPGEREREKEKDGRRERQIELLVSLENLFFPLLPCVKRAGALPPILHPSTSTLQLLSDAFKANREPQRRPPQIFPGGGGQELVLFSRRRIGAARKRVMVFLCFVFFKGFICFFVS